MIMFLPGILFLCLTGYKFVDQMLCKWVSGIAKATDRDYLKQPRHDLIDVNANSKLSKEMGTWGVYESTIESLFPFEFKDILQILSEFCSLNVFVNVHI